MIPRTRVPVKASPYFPWKYVLANGRKMLGRRIGFEDARVKQALGMGRMGGEEIALVSFNRECWGPGGLTPSMHPRRLGHHKPPAHVPCGVGE